MDSHGRVGGMSSHSCKSAVKLSCVWRQSGKEGRQEAGKPGLQDVQKHMDLRATGHGQDFEGRGPGGPFVPITLSGLCWWWSFDVKRLGDCLVLFVS